jgi:hypothetical protein
MKQNTFQKIVCVTIMGILLNGCGSPKTTSAPTQQPSVSPTFIPTQVIPTPTSIPEPPTLTNINIDGMADDWADRPATLDDPAGDAEEGFLDLTTGYSFVNQNALYFLIESVDPTAPFVQFDMQFQAGTKTLQISWAPGQQKGYLGDMTAGKPIGEIDNSLFAFGPNLEARVDLRDMGLPSNIKLIGVNVMAGSCCDYPNWRAVDQWQPGSTPVVNEKDPPRMVSQEMMYVLARRYQLPAGFVAEPVLEPPLPNLFDIAQSQSGIIYLRQYADQTGLSTFDPKTGKVTKILDFPTELTGWLVDGPNDSIFIGVNTEVWQVYPDGSYDVWSEKLDGWPTYYTTDGHLLAVSGDRTRILELFPDGTSIEIASGFDRIHDFVVNGEGIIFLTDFNRGDLIRIDPDGHQQVLADHIIDHDYIALYLDKDDNLFIFTPTVGLVQVDPGTGEFRQIGLSATHCNLVGSGFVITEDEKALFVNTQSQVIEVDLISGETKALLSNNGTWSWGMVIGPDDTLYLGAYDCPNLPSRITRIQDDGTSDTLVDGLMGNIIDLTFDQRSGLYIATYDGDYHIYYLPSTGDELTEIQGAPDGISSVIINQDNGHLFAAVFGGSLFEYNPSAGWSKRALQFPKPVEEFFIDTAPDGTIYAYASERDRQWTGPVVERWLLRLDLETGTSEIVAQYDRQGCCTAGNLGVDSQGNIWWILNPEDLLFRVTPEGQMTLFAQNLPQDSPKAVADSEGDIYISSILGVIRLHGEP